MDYLQEHDRIISQAKSENRQKVRGGTYYEAHHIIPICLGGEGKATQWRTHPNIVLLTAREHLLVHYYLTQIYPENHSLSFAFWNMCIGRGRNKERDFSEMENFLFLYEEARLKQAKAVSERLLGKKHTEEHRKRNSETKKGRIPWNKGLKLGPQSPEANRKRSNSLKGKRAKPIAQYALNGLDLIKVWSSQKEARKSTGISSIWDCLSGRQNTAGGFVWKYYLSNE